MIRVRIVRNFITVRPHRLHAVHRYGQLLQMSHVAWSVCLSVRVLGTRVSCAKTAKLIEMLFGGLTHMSLSNYILDGIQIPNGKGHFFLGGGHVPPIITYLRMSAFRIVRLPLRANVPA